MSLDLDALEAALAEPTDVVGVTLLGGEAYATRTLVALVAAAPALIAAARERDALRAIVERLSADLDTMHAGRTEARALVADLEARVEDLRADLARLTAAVRRYRACREGMQTQGGQSTIERRDSARELDAALAWSEP